MTLPSLSFAPVRACSFRFHSRGANRLAPALDVVAQDRCELFWRAGNRIGADHEKLLLEIFGGDAAVHFVVELRDDRARRSGGDEYPDPEIDFESFQAGFI